MPSRVVLLARALVFAVVTGWIVWGPLYRQVLHGRNEIFRPWVMFSGSGLAATQVRFYQKTAGGDLVALDRYSMLAPDEDPPPKSLQYVKDAAAVKRVGKRLCKALGDGADVRATLRVARRTGWHRAMAPEENLCVP